MKQRMVGALVLTALGVILWTAVFDPSQAGRFSRRSEIPPAPDFERFDISPAQRPGGLREIDKTVSETVSAERDGPDSDQPTGEAAASSAEEAETDEFGLPVLWAVQVGSFGRLENAQELKQKLEEAGYHVIVQSVEDAGQRMTRLFIDPKMDKRVAQRVRDQVNARFDTDSLVVRYYPG